ncbi:MAG: hypothetical protein D6722_26665, partial [Bacteroidetes bacterium]
MSQPLPFLLCLILLGGLTACKTPQAAEGPSRPRPGIDPARTEEVVAQRYVDATTQMIRGDLRTASELYQEVL